MRYLLYWTAIAAGFLLILILSACAAKAADYTTSESIAMWGEPKYKPGFTHFDYTNSNAPKGGILRQGALGTFDSLNQFTLKGVPAANLSMIYDTLMVSSSDEPFSKYGLVAKNIMLSKKNEWVAFTLREQARFHDGKKITADDVVFSFEALTTKGHPFWQNYYKDISKVEKISDMEVKFTFSNPANRELPLIIGQLPILPKHYFATRDIEKSTLEAPLGSGPYKIGIVEPGKRITYTRVKDYWAKDLPVNKGRYNFDTIQVDYYRDATVSLEAFKAGEYDLRQENIAKTWATGYQTPAVVDGRIILKEIQHEIPTGMQCFAFNIRKSKFSDKKVREALQYIFDFEWSNRQFFFDSYTRTQSYFSNSDFASTGLPQGLELSILGKLKSQLPERVFNETYQAPITDGSGNIRPSLLKARELLAQAGWIVKKGVLTGPDNEAMTIEFLLSSSSFERVVAPMLKNLKKLGIEATMRTVDSAQYIKRLEQFDFDMIVHGFGQSNSPGNEQRDYWFSSNANLPGSQNVIGIENPAIDALVEQLIDAKDKDTLLAATRALDRALLWNFYVIPNWHVRSFRIAYWNKFGFPDETPLYDFGLDSWWAANPKVNQTH